MGMLSKRCEYGLRAALFLVTQRSQRPYVSIREISDTLDVSFHFLTKILQALTEGGLLTSYRGPSGGVALAKDAHGITVLNLIECLEGPELFKSCVLGLEGCGARKPCPLHAEWSEQRKSLRDLFSRTSLAELGKKTAHAGLRLTN
jgi:Rrf2 family iron-sulfur cluster assembly transcriptional regulator